LLDLVRSSSKIQELNFPNNELGNDCGGLLAEIIGMQSGLLKVNLAYNKLANYGEEFAKQITKNRRLKQLDLGGNGIKNQWIFKIESILDRNNGKMKENVSEKDVQSKVKLAISSDFSQTLQPSTHGNIA